jgi:hypothetical protein
MQHHTSCRSCDGRAATKDTDNEHSQARTSRFSEDRLLGDIVHQGATYPGQHKAILDPELWQTVQGKLAANRQERALGVGAEAPSLLAGLIVDADGSPMTPTHAHKESQAIPLLRLGVTSG